MTKSKKRTPYPNQDTLWSYYMQAIEPCSQEINTAFPEYHPMWVIQSQRKTVSSDYFKHMRECILQMTRIQCAAYLRVTITDVKRWETGKEAVPFAIFELLRLVSESVHFRLSNQSWQGWFINQKGRLISPDRGNLSFSHEELSFIRETHQAKASYEVENRLLRAEIEPLRAEIAAMRVADSNNELLSELKAIESRLAEMAAKVTNNNVVHINHVPKTTEPPKGKAA